MELSPTDYDSIMRHAEQTHILVVGGPVSTNIVEGRPGTAAGQFVVQNRLQPVADPIPGVGGDSASSIWIPFAREFERRRRELGFGELLLSVIANEDYGVGDWVPGGRAFHRLEAHLGALDCRPPDFVISQVGERDRLEDTTFASYVALFCWFYRRLLQILGPETPWILCKNGQARTTGTPVSAAQWALTELIPNCWPGPDLSYYSEAEWTNGKPTQIGAERLGRELVECLSGPM